MTSSPELWKSIFISFFSAFLAASFATRKFRFEKMWERKLDAYSKLLESLAELRQSLASLGGFLKTDTTGDKLKIFEMLSPRLVLAMEQVDKAILVSGLVLSKDCQPILREIKIQFAKFPIQKVKELLKAQNKVTEADEVIREIYVFISETADKVKIIAHKELGTAPG